MTKVEAGFKDVMANVLKNGFTDDELKAAKSGMMQARKVSRSQDKELTGILSSDLYTGKDMAWRKAYEQHLSSLTKQQVIAAMRKYLKVNNFSIITAADKTKMTHPSK